MSEAEAIIEGIGETWPDKGLSHTIEIGKLVEALAAARKSFKKVVKDSNNPFFKSKYADLATVIEAVTPALCENGLIVLQSCRVQDNLAIITTKLAHSSGQWLQDELALPMAKFDAQGAGSAFTYARRYSLSAFLNVAADTDDDGNAASVGTDKKFEKDFDQRTEEQRLVDAKQIAAWNSAKAKGVRTDAQISAKFKASGIFSIEEMPKNKFDAAIKWLLTPDKGDLTKVVTDSLPKANPLNFSKLFALAGELDVPEGDVKQHCYEVYNITSMTELTPLQFDETMRWLKEVTA
jgi:hypothetical protein